MENKEAATEAGFAAALGTQIVLQFDGSEERFKSHLVGLEPGSFLILAMPRLDRGRSQLIEAPGLILRYVYAGSVYGFRARLQGHILNPSPLLFLSYPPSVESLNLRKKHRVTCRIPATATVRETRLEGIILDLSASGCRLSARLADAAVLGPIQLGEEISLRFPLLGFEGDRTFVGKARNISQSKEALTIGLEFVKMGAETVRSIETYVRRVVEYPEPAGGE